MKQSILALALALGLSAGLGTAAYADESAPASPQAHDQVAQMPTPSAQSALDDPYAASLTRSFASPYDIGDAFLTPDGSPLQGWEQMNYPF